MAQRVEKLDNPEIFNAIPSGHKTIAGLKHYEKAKFNSLFNQFKLLGMFGLTESDRTKLGWFAENWFEIIEYVLPGGHRQRTLHYDKKKFKPRVRSLFNTGLSMQQRIDKLTEQEKKNFVPYEELARKREQLQIA